MSYTTIDNVRRVLGIDTFDDDDILALKITAAQAEVERFCGRIFEATTATRYYTEDYDGFDGKLLLLDGDLQSVTTLTNGDGTVIPSGGYWLEPRNQSYYQVIHLKSTYDWTFDTDGQVSVLGSWGRSATAPADIVEVTTELAAYLYRLKDVSSFTLTTIPDTGDTPVPIDIPKHVKAALAGYRSLI